MLSSSLEEYLKTMYVLQTTTNHIRVTDVSKKMGRSKPSVNRALNCLKDEDLIEYEAYGNIELTKKGIETAKSIIKRYDILRLFLTEIIGIDMQTAKIEAEQMKYSISEGTIKKLENYIIKILGLEDLKCNYDLSNNRCQKCARITTRKEKVNKIERNYANE